MKYHEAEVWFSISLHSIYHADCLLRQDSTAMAVDKLSTDRKLTDDNAVVLGNILWCSF